MDQKKYLALIEDALSYIQQLQPKAEKGEIEAKPKMPPPPLPPKEKKSISSASESNQSLQATLKKDSQQVPQDFSPLAADLPKKCENWELEPPPASQIKTPPTLRKTLKEIDPDLYLHESIPSDFKAKRIKEAWKEKHSAPMIPILFQGQKYRSFVVNIAKAINTLYGSCRLIDIAPERKWDLFLESENLKLIIAPDNIFFATKKLLPFYREDPETKSKRLGKIPLLLLPDLSLYFKDPYLKRALWNVIQSTLNRWEENLKVKSK